MTQPVKKTLQNIDRPSLASRDQEHNDAVVLKEVLDRVVKK
jgi:hypothetical protein